MDLKGRVTEHADWIHVTHVEDCWQALVNDVMNIRVPRKACNILNKQSDYQFVSFVLLGCCAAWVGS
jgi:hypothetical protein